MEKLRSVFKIKTIFSFAFVVTFSVLGYKTWLFFQNQPVAIVLPHHNLVQDTRQKFLKSISSSRLTTRHIVLLSPDHFSRDQSKVTTSNRNWNLSTGNANFNNFLQVDLPFNDGLLQEDHGLFNPLADLVTYFPKADYFPILIGQKTTPNQLQPILEKILSNCKSDCLLVVSVDFSHYLPATLASVHDAYTINNLQNLDLDKILLSEVDSPQSLYLLVSYAKQRNAQKFKIFDHTNSGIIANDPDIETTTHVFGSYTLGNSNKGHVSTYVHLPGVIDRLQSQDTVGDRFFYGVDKFVNDSYVPNFVISQISSPHQVIKSYLPIKGNNFVRGKEKSRLIQQYFDSIPSESVVKDYFWGTLIYEQ